MIDCHSRRRIAKLVPALLCAAAAAAPCLDASAQTRKTPPSKTPLEEFVPASANIFVSIQQAEEVEKALERAHAWRLIPLVTGTHPDTGKDLSLRGILTAFLGSHRTVKLDELLASELGLISSSWQSFDDATWIVRPQKPESLLTWFPDLSQGKRQRFYGARGGLVVCAHDDCAIMNRGGGTTFGGAMVLLAGHNAPSLHDDPTYRELIAYLPKRPLATAYIHDATAAAGLSLIGLPQSVDRAALGLYEGQGRIDVALRAALTNELPQEELSAETVQRMLMLPSTTLLATALTPRWPAGAERSNSTLAALERLLTLARGMSSADDEAAIDPLEFVGKQWVIAWDQDFRPHSSSPQFAGMSRCDDAEGIHKFLTGMFQNVRKLVAATENIPESSLPALAARTHLGTTVHYVSMIEYADHSKFPFAKMLRHVEPAWAIVGDWLVVGLSRDHVERIIDAYRGLLPRLDTVRDAADIARRPVRRTSLTVLQADLASGVIREWLHSLEKREPSILEDRYWPVPDSEQRRSLGIGMDTEHHPGAVLVARVYPGTVADGVLQPGDRILAIDGRVLDIRDPNRDLRSRWLSAGERQETRLFRIEREGEISDVEVHVNLAQLHAEPVRPAVALRELASLASTVEFTSIATYLAQSDRFSARISLRFKPSR